METGEKNDVWSPPLLSLSLVYIGYSDEFSKYTELMYRCGYRYSQEDISLAKPYTER